MAVADPRTRRRALLIATASYSDPGLAKLRAPVGDVQSLAEVLGDRAIGAFEVRKLVDRPTDEVKREIEDFFQEARRDELLLLYVSGHGVLSNNRRFYFATSSTMLKWLRSTAVEDAFVNDVMEHSRARTIVLVLDCCHSGAFTRGLRAKSAVAAHVEQRFEGHGRVTLTASTELEYAFEETEVDAPDTQISEVTSPLATSVFTRSLVDGLRSGDADANEDGFISVDELYDYVCERVRERAPGQTPGMAGDVRGDIKIARSDRVAVGLPPEVTDAIKSPLPSVRKGVVSDLAQLLRSATPGVAAAAEEALVALADDDSRQVSELAGQALEDRTERRTPASPQREPVTLLLEPEIAGPRSVRGVVPRGGGRLLLAAGAVVAAVAVAILALGARGPSGTGLAYDFDGDRRQEVVLGAFVDAEKATAGTPPGRVLIHEGPEGSQPSVIEAELPGVDETLTDFGRGLASADFNGDEWADLAISAPGTQRVAIRYGSRDGLGEEPDDVLEGSRMDLPARSGLYGWNLVASDLDDDQHADLVVGAPGTDQKPPSGAVQILFGGPEGLDKADSITIRPREDTARFGARLRIGDIDGNGRPDLVEGSPDEKGLGHGLYCLDVASPARDCRAMKGPGENGTSSLAVADVDGDGDGDVVQGDTRDVEQAPGEGKQATAGEIRLWEARSTGLSRAPEVITQASLGLPAELGDEFGAGVEAADLDGDGRAELIAGAPGASRVYVIDHRGPGDDVAQVVPDPDGEESRFGFGLALLRLGGDADRLDLAVVSTPTSEERAVRVVEDLGDSSAAAASLPGLADELTVEAGATIIALGRVAGN